MTTNLPNRDTLAALISLSGNPRLKDYERADAVLDHLRATSPPPASATDGLRERIVGLEAALAAERRWSAMYREEAADLRAALAATGRPETTESPCMHFDHPPWHCAVPPTDTASG